MSMSVATFLCYKTQLVGGVPVDLDARRVLVLALGVGAAEGTIR